MIQNVIQPKGFEVFLGPRMDGEHDVGIDAQPVNQIHHKGTPLLVVHGGRTVHGQQVKLVGRGQPQISQNGALLNLWREGHEGVDHGVAHEVHVVASVQPLGFEVLKAGLFSHKMH